MCARRPARKIEKTQEYFAEVEGAIREIVGNDQIDVILDNIGLPYSGINIALSDTATVGPMDGEILISLNEKHTPTPQHMADLRRELPKRFPQLQFFFQPADIVESGAELRSAGADRHPRLGPERRRGLCARRRSSRATSTAFPASSTRMSSRFPTRRR